jgi:SnoaL-like domain
MLDMYAVYAVLDVSRVFVDENPRQGREDMRSYWEQMWDISGGMRSDPVEVLDVGEGRYLVLVAFGMVGKLSGVDVTGNGAGLYTLRDGLIARLDLFADRETALEAVGLAT